MYGLSRLLLAAGLVLGLVATADAQFTLTAGDESGRLGDTIEVVVTLDSDELIYGFQIAIAHDAALVTLDDILQGAALDSLNEDEGPGYFLVELDPGGTGGDGGYAIMITGTFDKSFAELPAGDDQEVLIYSYFVVSDATPGEVSDLLFTDELCVSLVDPKDTDSACLLTIGDTIVTNEDAASIVPDLFDGSITILTPSVQDLVCEVTDPCTCEVTLTWDNPVDFATITIFKDDVEIASLTEGEASYTTSEEDSESGTFTFAVISTADDEDGPEVTCEIECLEIPPPDAPEDLTCGVDAETCEVTMTWSNIGEYVSLSVLLDGEEIANLEGDVAEHSFTLEGSDTQEITLIAVDSCDAETEGVTCEVLCSSAPEFKRGDANNDGTVSGLADGLFLLFWQFIPDSPEPMCMDAADANDNGAAAGLSDGLFLLFWQFLPDQSTPPLPGPDDCGPDPTADLNPDDPDDLEFDIGCETTSDECL